jgi:hypothetical protein
VGTRPKAVSAKSDGSSVNPVDFLVAFLGQFDVTKSAEIVKQQSPRAGLAFF